MSTAYNKRKKARRKQLDEANPDRPRIRRLIKKGLMPRWFMAKLNGTLQMYKTGFYSQTVKGHTHKFKLTWPSLRSTFVELTKEKAV